MIIVKFFSSFCSSENCSNIYSRLRLIENNILNTYNDTIIFTNSDNYTHAVILNTAMPKLTIPKENVLGLAFEPNYFLGLNKQFIDYAAKNIGKYYIGDNTGLTLPFIEHHGFMWYTPIPIQIENKNKIMSIIFSNKKSTFGHKYRHSLINTILQTNLPIDIYGIGCSGYNQRDNRIKGTFTENEPYDGYMFSIAIENLSLNSYISEKFINCLMYETTPVYYGCKTLDQIEHFKDKYIRLNGDIGPDMLLITDIIANPLKYKKNINRYEEANSINLIEHLYTLFKKDE